ncbi:WYL domain-containing protein [Paucibacter sp. APW11]|uniref:WYL domain-containing protein n=1 Tax=Roseateles aquae TaxID=3077235 RepID=A0ABU3P6B5_9BURK|nr:WYL domain-containing protein [Paucibacter sp. APW11]MDT8998098.1 WYL domain-containing protein [Paucibacter sp. APW11]
MRSSRLLGLLMLLQWRGRMAAPALAREFEVTVRTIYRDVDALSAAGVPIYAERGAQGGIALHEGWRTQVTGLSADEAGSLPLLGLGSAARELGLGDAALAAQLKLMASLPPDAGASAQRMAERFHIDPLPWYQRAESPPWLPQLATAVLQSRCVRIHYQSWKARRWQTLAPLGLVLKGGLWYLVALRVHDAEADAKLAAKAEQPRNYRVSSIAALEVLERAFKRPRRFALAQHWPAAVASFEQGLLAGQARVRISELGCQILRAQNAIAAEHFSASCAPSETAGWFEGGLPIEGIDQAARQLLALGAEVKVLSPRALQQRLLQEAHAVLTHYAGDATN